MYLEFLFRRAHSRSRVDRRYWSGESLYSRTTCSNSVMVGVTGPIGSGLPQLGFPRRFAMGKKTFPTKNDSPTVFPEEFDSKKCKGNSFPLKKSAGVYAPRSNKHRMKTINNNSFPAVSQKKNGTLRPFVYTPFSSSDFRRGRKPLPPLQEVRLD